MVKFTVFTPTYNRAHTLGRVFHSLCRQTMKDFEWLVVDNGSTDGTKELILNSRLTAQFPVRYLKEPRRGKHFCHNLAIQLARGEFFLVLDSDDAIVDNALECLNNRWKEIPSSLREWCCGVVCRCMDPYGNPIGSDYSAAERYSTLAERIYIHKLWGEHWGSMRTDIVRRFPYPEIDSFIPEGLVWLRIAKAGYYDYCCNDALRIYYGSPPDGLSRLGLTRGKIVYAREMLIRDWAFIRHAPMRFARAALLTLASPFLLPVTR